MIERVYNFVRMLKSYVPYTGATADVDLGDKKLTTTDEVSMGSGYVNSVFNLGKSTQAADLYIHNGGGIWVYEPGDNFLCSAVCKDGAAEWQFNDDVNIGASGAAENLYVWGNAYNKTDNGAYYFGAGDDASIYFDGANLNIDTDLVAASDLNIDCGTDKTLVLEETVYNDANVGGLALRGGVTNPPITQWVDNAGNNTGIYGLGFAVLDEANGVIEIPHDYKEGTNLMFHVHWGANAAPSDTDYVKWQLTYSVTRAETTFPPPPIAIVVEVAYDTRYESKFSNFPTITGTNFKIGDQFNFNVKRIAADGAAYAGVAIMETIGFHYECDTLGSRQIGTK